MARFSRGQPHAPITLRNAAALIVAAAAAASSNIHVVGQAVAAAQRPLVIERSRASVIFLSPNNRSTVPLRLAPQLFVVGQAVPAAARFERRTEQRKVQYLRPSVTSLVPARLAPQIHVVSLANPLAARHPSRDADVLYLRNLAPPAQLALSAPQIHVVSLALSLASRRPGRKAGSQYLRAPLPPIGPPPAHVVLVAARTPPRRATTVSLRNPAAPAAPAARAAPTHVITVAVSAARRVGTRILIARPALPSLIFPDRVPSQSHVLLQLRQRALPRTAVLLVRNRLVPPPLPPVILVFDGDAVRKPKPKEVPKPPPAVHGSGVLTLAPVSVRGSGTVIPKRAKAVPVPAVAGDVALRLAALHVVAWGTVTVGRTQITDEEADAILLSLLLEDS